MIGKAVAAWSWRSSSPSFGTLLISPPCLDCSSVFVSSDFLCEIPLLLDHIDGVISGVDPKLCTRSLPSVAKCNGFHLGQISESKHRSIVISVCKLMVSFGIPPDLIWGSMRGT